VEASIDALQVLARDALEDDGDFGTPLGGMLVRLRDGRYSHCFRELGIAFRINDLVVGARDRSEYVAQFK
jgi:hypothetical protein